MKRYYTLTLKKLVTVQHLLTIEYFTAASGFTYPPESHDFYEFIFVESGNITCAINSEIFELTQNSFLLIPTGNLHSYSVEKKHSAKVLIVCFKSKSNIISILQNKIFSENIINELIKKVLDEAHNTFIFPFKKKLKFNNSPRLGSSQLIENYIEEVLIRLIQIVTYNEQKIEVMADPLALKSSITKEIISILEENLYSKITLTQICDKIFYSKTYLNNTFKELKGVTIMQYYTDMKVEEAKLLLKKNFNVSQVSEKLSFDNPQYFAKVFKSKVGITPTQYKNQILKGRDETNVAPKESSRRLPII